MPYIYLEIHRDTDYSSIGNVSADEDDDRAVSETWTWAQVQNLGKQGPFSLTCTILLHHFSIPAVIFYLPLLFFS